MCVNVNEYKLVRTYLSSGDAEAARTLFAPYEKPLFGYLWNMLKNQQDSEDALQDTFCKALNALPKYKEDNHFKSWLYRIAHNTAVDQIRKRRKVVVMDDVHPTDAESDAQPTPTQALNKKEQYRDLKNAVASLTQKEREVVTLRFLSDLSFKEIAQITGEPIGTVLSRVSRAKDHLKSLIKQTCHG